MSVITLDLETTGLDWTKDKIVLLGYRIDGGEVVQTDGISERDGRLYSLLIHPDTVLRGHNIKFDAHFLRACGYRLECSFEDTRVMAYHAWPDMDNHDLKGLVRSKLGGTPSELDDILFKPLKKERYHIDEAYSDFYYQMGDGKVARKDLLKAYHIEDILNVDRLRAIMTPTEWFTEVEVPLTRMIYEMEAYGCPLDLKHLEKLKDEMESKQKALFEALGGSEEFNPGSNPQIAQRLIELGYKLEEITTKTDKGAWQVDAPMLKKLAHKGDKFAETLLKYKRNNKLLSTFVAPFIEGAKLDKRLHGSFNQAGSEDAYGDGARGTKTGRLSSSNPNLQNIPSRTKQGKEVRKAFIAEEGETLFDTDLAQIEPRLLGHYSQSPKLIKAYNDGLDTHGMFAADIFGHTLDYYSEENRKTYPEREIERFIGKTSSLATVYGCSYKKLLAICSGMSDNPLTLDTKKYEHLWGWLPLKDRARVQKYEGKDAESTYAKWMYFKAVQDNFWRNNPEIKAWRDGHIARTLRLGYVITIGGRIIRITGLDSLDIRTKLEAERKAINFLIQGSAADVMKRIMVETYNRVIIPGKGRIFAVIHDELLGSLKDEKDTALVKDIMENTTKLRNIPIKADVKLIKTWAEK